MGRQGASESDPGTDCMNASYMPSVALLLPLAVFLFVLSLYTVCIRRPPLALASYLATLAIEDFP